MERLFAGSPRVVSVRAPLSRVVWAEEAGVGRATLYRVLARVPELAAAWEVGAAESDPHHRVRELEAEIARLKRQHAEEVRTLRGSIETLANHVQALTVALRLKGQRSADVLPLDAGRRGT